MKYSEKFTLEIKMKEFYQLAIPLISNKKELHKHIRQELMQSLNGMFSGDFGGNYNDDWEGIFYYQLFKAGIIDQTQKSIDRFGKFSK